MSPTSSSTREIDTSKDNIYSASILIANLPSPSDYHVLESAIRNATRSTKDRLVIILHSPAFANQEVPRAGWFEIQRLLTWTYVESAAVAQDMDKVLLDTDVLLRSPHARAAEGTAEDGDLVKKADALYVFKDGWSRIPSEGLCYPLNTSDCRLGYIPMVDFQVLQSRLHLQTYILECAAYSPPTRHGQGQTFLPNCCTGWDVRSPSCGAQDSTDHGGVDRSEEGCRWCYRSVVSPWFPSIDRNLTSHLH